MDYWSYPCAFWNLFQNSSDNGIRTIILKNKNGIRSKILNGITTMFLKMEYEQ
jgi:hypothetical protein